VLGAALLGAAVLLGWIGFDRDDLLDLTQRLAGETRYRVDFRDETIGLFSSTTTVDRRTVTFTSRFAVQMPHGEPIDSRETLTFAATAPYSLLHASRQGLDGGLHIDLEGDHYLLSADDNEPHRQIGLDYTLVDHLALEQWLATASPAIGDERIVQGFDFDRLAVRPQRYVVTARSEDGWTLRSAELLEDKLVQLDDTLTATAFSIAGIVTLTRIADDVEPELRTRTRAPQLKVALAVPIDAPQKASRLVLRVAPKIAQMLTERDTPTLRADRRAGETLLTIEAGARRPSRTEELIDATRATLDYPIDDDHIRASVHLLRTDTSDEQLVRAILHFVGNHLTYDETARPVDLLMALRTRRGDCTEFADLFTTLARSAGMAANTVTGLVYDEVAGPGFYLHAWSEVVVDGEWIAVDPTSGQMPADATHIPFPRSETGFLRAYAALPEMRFEVVTVERNW